MSNANKKTILRHLRARWYYPTLLAFTVALAYFGDFRPSPKTEEVWLESSFTDEEETQVVAAIKEWNEVMRFFVGRNVLTYRGRIDDADGYQPKDLADDRHVIYRRTENFLEGASCDSCVGRSIEGEDIEIFPNRLDDMPSLFEIAVLHELGHLLVNGEHNMQPGSIMFEQLFADKPKLTRYDMAYYCRYIRCR